VALGDFETGRTHLTAAGARFGEIQAAPEIARTQAAIAALGD